MYSIDYLHTFVINVSFFERNACISLHLDGYHGLQTGLNVRP